MSKGGVRPADYPPPFSPSEVIAPPTDPAAERIEVGVLIVGAGPAGLACAIRLGQLLEESPEIAERLGEVPVAVVEKGKAPGSHLLSGAVVNPRALRRLFRDRLTIEDVPNYGVVHGEAVYLLTQGTALRIPPPPTMRNHGNYIVSVSQLGRFLAEQAEALGAAVLPETDAQKLLVADGRVHGIRTGDKGLGRDGRAGRRLRAGLGHRREGDDPRGGHAGPPDQRPRSTASASRASSRRSGRSASRRSGRSRRRSAASSTRWAGRCASAPSTASSAARSSTRWATTWSRSASSPGSSPATSSSRSTTSSRS